MPFHSTRCLHCIRLTFTWASDYSYYSKFPYTKIIHRRDFHVKNSNNGTILVEFDDRQKNQSKTSRSTHKTTRQLIDNTQKSMIWIEECVRHAHLKKNEQTLLKILDDQSQNSWRSRNSHGKTTVQRLWQQQQQQSNQIKRIMCVIVCFYSINKKKIVDTPNSM